MLELQVPGILLRSVKLPNSPMVNYGFPGFLFGELGRTGARAGLPDTEERQKSAIFISPGVLTFWTEMVILIQDRERELENARVSAKFIGPSEDCVAGDCCVLPPAAHPSWLTLQSNSQNSSK